jgi:hypothetical protein
MRCPSCCRFVALDTDVEPELDLAASADGVSVSARIINACAECGEELREATLEMHCEVDLAAHEDHELEASAEAERTSRTEGRGRGTKTFYGCSGVAVVRCACRKEPLVENLTFADDIQASSMDEL